jgi:hypothetical protein
MESLVDQWGRQHAWEDAVCNACHEGGAPTCEKLLQLFSSRLRNESHAVLTSSA